MMPALVETERVEAGFEMPAHPVRADQLPRSVRVAPGLAQLLGVDRRHGARAIRGAPGCPVAPEWSMQLGEHRRPVVVDFGEEPAPAFVDGIGSLEKPGIE